MDLSQYPYEIYNGHLVKSGSLLFSANNRAFKYGDGVFETIRVINQHPLFLQDHWMRLTGGLSALSIPLPVNFDLPALNDAIQVLLQKNGQKQVRLRLVVYREAAGFYKPSNMESSWHLSISGFIDPVYQSSLTGLSADVYEDDYKTCGALSNLKTLNSLLYISAGVKAIQNGFDDMFILNHKGHLVESVNANLFLRRGKTFITPPLSEGCLDGVMRKQVIRLLKSKKLSIDEVPVQLADALEADEILLTNVIHGAGWISKFRGIVYGCEYSALINGWLNDECNLK